MWHKATSSAALGVPNGKQLGIQLLGVLAIGAWTCILSALLFMALKATGKLRVDADTEEKGIDQSKHGGDAYNGVEA